MYLIVSKFNPKRFGSRKSLRLASHVPSPTYMVFELYVLLPGGERLSFGAIVSPQPRRSSSPLLPDGSESPLICSLNFSGFVDIFLSILYRQECGLPSRSVERDVPQPCAVVEVWSLSSTAKLTALSAVVNKAYRVRSWGNACSPPKCKFVCALM